MKTPLPNDLLEATRLTRAGRLAEATAMLQRALGVQAAPGGADPEERRKVQAFLDRLVERALAYGGTSTGEHGVGQGKISYLAAEHGAGISAMIAIKKALDPLNILNPGKIAGTGILVTLQTSQRTAENALPLSLNVLRRRLALTGRAWRAQRLWTWAAKDTLHSLLSIAVGVGHDHAILILDEVLHLLEVLAHLGSAANKADKNLSVSGVALRISNGQVIHESYNVL